MWSNLHTHSRYCDGSDELHVYADMGENLHLYSIGFSSHAPLPFDCKWCMKAGTFSDYLTNIEQLRSKHPGMDIYKGLEVDFIPGVVSPADFANQLDYTIGSIHFVESFPDGRRWEIDGPFADFSEGLEVIFKNNIHDAVVRYFELTREMITKSSPTIVGHIDKIKIQNKFAPLFSETESWYREQLTTTLDLIAEVGSIVEVNTRGLYQKKSNTAYPSPWVVEQLHQKKIPVTLSSDAHHPKDLVSNFSETAIGLRQAGHTKLSVLHEGSWKEVPFHPFGINI